MNPLSRPIAITMGDPAGVGPEIIAKVFAQHAEASAGCIVVGDVSVLRRAVQAASLVLPVAVIESPSDAAEVPPRCLPVWPSSRLAEPVPWGQVSAQAGRAAAAAIEQAAQAALSGQVAALVTAPLHKESLAAAGVSHPGHTEYLQALSAEYLGVPVAELPVRMMLSNHELHTVLVSIHLSLRDAIARVTLLNVLETLRITHRHWTQTLGRPRCRIAVAGLNPHAGEGGLFGREEIDTIAPAIAQARALGIDASGPYAPDTVFMRARQGEFDVVLAMYHDQGLIPVKYLGLEHGVNTTLGLPFVRTSPDHGTAFDLAGTGRAEPSSLLAALESARRSALAVPR